MSLKVMVSGAAFLSMWMLKSPTSSTLPCMYVMSCSSSVVNLPQNCRTLVGGCDKLHTKIGFHQPV